MTQERITVTDRDALAFIARFPGADTEAVAQALVANPSRFDDKVSSIHPTESVVSRRLAKLERLGCIQSWRSPAAQLTHHGILEGGMDALELFGQAPGIERGIAKKTGLALMHGRDIANVAAQIMHGEYADKRVTNLTGKGVTIDRFVTDSAIHSAVSTLYRLEPNFDLHEHSSGVFKTVTDVELSDPNFWHLQPELLAFSAPADTPVKHATHRPDLVVLTETGRRVAIEVERNVKSYTAYVDTMRLLHQTLTTFKNANGETVAPITNLVWLCTNEQIKNALTKAANTVTPALIKSGTVIIADLTRADGSALTYGETVPAPTRRSMRPAKLTDAPVATRPPEPQSPAKSGGVRLARFSRTNPTP